MGNNNRHTGIELFRIILMLMIAMHHIIVHGLGLATEAITLKMPQPILSIELLYNSILVIGVNSFVLISGYWGIRFKYKGFISLLLQGSIYSIIIGSFCHYMAVDSSFSPFQYWFLVAYLALYLSAQYINAAIESLDNNGAIRLIAVVVFLQCGFGYLLGENDVYGGGCSYIQIASMYVIGRCMFKLKDCLAEIKNSTLSFALIASYSTILAIEMLCIKTHYRFAWTIFQYDNPLVMLNSCVVFLLFLKIKYKSSVINSLSPYMFGVYLLHDNNAIREHVIKVIVPSQISNWTSIFQIPLLAIVILLIGVAVDVPISRFISILLNLKPLNSLGRYFTQLLSRQVNKLNQY